MRVGRLRWPSIGLASIAVFAPSGCSSVQEPPSAFTSIGPLSHHFQTVWEAASEALQDEGFPVESSDRGKEEGTMVSRIVPGRDDKLAGTQEGRRIRARVEKLGTKSYRLFLAASRFERDMGSGGQTPSDWRYVGSDDELLGRLRVRFDKALERRYRAPEGG
jgi:hypothetical protein